MTLSIELSLYTSYTHSGLQHLLNTYFFLLIYNPQGVAGDSHTHTLYTHTHYTLLSNIYSCKPPLAAGGITHAITTHTQSLIYTKTQHISAVHTSYDRFFTPLYIHILPHYNYPTRGGLPHSPTPTLRLTDKYHFNYACLCVCLLRTILHDA